MQCSGHSRGLSVTDRGPSPKERLNDQNGGRMSEKASWMTRKREQRRERKAMRGDSPEKLEEHHRPKPGLIDRMLRAEAGGQRPSRYKDIS